MFALCQCRDRCFPWSAAISVRTIFLQQGNTDRTSRLTSFCVALLTAGSAGLIYMTQMVKGPTSGMAGGLFNTLVQFGMSLGPCIATLILRQSCELMEPFRGGADSFISKVDQVTPLKVMRARIPTWTTTPRLSPELATCMV